MIVVNFSHPLSPQQRQQLEACCGRSIDRVVEVKVQFRHESPFGPQAVAAIEKALK